MNKIQNKLKIKITGSNGYLGRQITKQLQINGHEVSGIDRKLLYGEKSALADEIAGCDVIINLAGANILRRWTKKNRETIYNSRISTTRILSKAIKGLPETNRPKKFISASAIGIYTAGNLHNEDSKDFAKNYLGKVVIDWENEVHQLPESVQKIIFRIGVVLGKESKSIKKMLLPFQLGLGGKIGNGKQAFPFIHERDLVKAFLWAAENQPKKEIYNLVAPEIVSNAEFTKTLAKHLNRPAFLPVPGFVLKILFGEAASLLLGSPLVEPKALLEEQFEYSFPTVKKTLEEIIK